MTATADIIITREELLAGPVLSVAPADLIPPPLPPPAFVLSPRDLPHPPRPMRIRASDLGPPVEILSLTVEEILNPLGAFTERNYHGTSSGTSEIIRREGWHITGRHGLALGPGVYFSVGSDTHAMRIGEVIRARVAWGNTLYTNDRETRSRYQDWCSRHGGCAGDWGVAHGYHGLMNCERHIEGQTTVGVMLHPRTSGSERWRTPRIEIAEVNRR